MIPHPQPYTDEQIASMIEMCCKYPEIQNACEKCEYCPTSGMRKGCCDFGYSDIARILRYRPVSSHQSERDLSARLTAKTVRCKQLEEEHQNFCFYIKKVSELEAELKANPYNPAIERDKMLDITDEISGIATDSLFHLKNHDIVIDEISDAFERMKELAESIRSTKGGE